MSALALTKHLHFCTHKEQHRQQAQAHIIALHPSHGRFGTDSSLPHTEITSNICFLMHFSSAFLTSCDISLSVVFKAAVKLS